MVMRLQKEGLGTIVGVGDAGSQQLNWNPKVDCPTGLYMLCFYFYFLLYFCFGVLGGVEYLIWDYHLVWSAFERAPCELLCV